MKLDNKISLEQKQTLSLAQLHALKILSLDNFELNQFLQNEYTENPLMEYNVISDLPPTVLLRRISMPSNLKLLPLVPDISPSVT